MIETLLNGRFRIVRLLGTGNFGKTFLAEDTHIMDMDAECAVKRLTTPKDPNDIEIVRAKFKLEAKKLHALNHQGIPKLISYFEYEGEFYLAQDLIQGHTLDNDIHAHKKWTESEVKDFLLEMLEILAYVHSQGSIHRDLKPNNIMLRHLDKKLMLIDFGAVKEVRNTGSNLEVGQASDTVVIGTAAYMSPEQAKGKPCFASDVYSLGCIAIEALIGKSPNEFEHDPYLEIMWRNQVRVSDDFAKIIDKMVRYKSVERYANGSEVLTELKKLQTNATPNKPKPDEVSRRTNNTPNEPKPDEVPRRTLRQKRPADSPSQNPPPKNPNLLTKFLRREVLIFAGLTGVSALGVIILGSRLNNEEPNPKPSKTPTLTPSATPTPIKSPTQKNSLSTPPFEPIQETVKIKKVDSFGKITSEEENKIQYFRDSRVKLKNGEIPLDLALIPNGLFNMGSPDSEKGREADEFQHKVNFPRDFYMGRFTITQAQWIAVMKNNDNLDNQLLPDFQGSNRPMVCVTWHDAQRFCKALNALLPKGSGTYRLPTEAEWEYACRANAKPPTPFHFGETITTSLVNYRGEKNRGKTIDVNDLPANAWGLYQMHGNVWEWCLDEYAEDAYIKKSKELRDDGSKPYGIINVNNNDKRFRSHRGGSYDSSVARDCRSADRHASEATAFFGERGHVGFRVVFDPS